MKITPHLFEAFLRCPTKCWLRATGEAASGNTYAEWVKDQNEAYRAAEAERLLAQTPPSEYALSPPAENLKAAKWRLAVNVAVAASDLPRSSRREEAPSSPPQPSTLSSQPASQSLVTSAATDQGAAPPATFTAETRLHAVERVPSESRGKAAQFIPILFIFRNKLTKDDKLLVAFEAFVLSEMLGREVSLARIIHGADHATLRVKTVALSAEVRKRLDRIAALLSSLAPPDLILNRHCPECEFQTRCRQKALEKDDLSLLAGMSEKERKKLHSKGIFTVTQLSYTFRPRRRPKRLRDKREKYHHSLKALAIREKKIHIVGSPELKIEGTPVYLDVEGLPDRDFYYLIGVRIGNGDSAVQHSLWADTVEDEGKIWHEFLAILETVEKPVLIHYGSYETEFIRELSDRFGAPTATAPGSTENQKAINLLSVLLEQVYFPTYSNSLKEVGAWLGSVWSEASPIGVNSVACRCEWERTRNLSMKARLIAYNDEDCRAAEIVTQALLQLHAPGPRSSSSEKPADAVYVESLKKAAKRFGPFVSQFKELEEMTLAAWWNYQRDRIYVRSAKAVKRNSRSSRPARAKWWDRLRAKIVILCPDQTSCPFCGGTFEEICRRTRTLYDLSLGRTLVKRRIVKYRFHQYLCSNCERKFGEPREFWPGSHFGRNLVAYVVYETIHLRIPFVTVQKNLSRFFGLDLPEYTLRSIKRTAVKHYEVTYEGILRHLVTGSLLHVDETGLSTRGKPAYVWVFTNLDDVAYMYAEGREGTFLHEMLKDFRGILVTDFYGVYDSLACDQQKCLVHLMRDLNDAVLGHPYDEVLKGIVREFAALLKPMIETIDRRGLKRRFLRKHRIEVKRFYRKLGQLDCRSEPAIKCRQRFEKNRDKLFTFLSHDDVPWNNNNAEHAVRAFAQLRDIVRGSFTPASARDYLILLSICQTCKYMGVDFLDFLRSGEKDIHAFAERRRRRRRQSPDSEPQESPADAPAGE